MAVRAVLDLTEMGMPTMPHQWAHELVILTIQSTQPLQNDGNEFLIHSHMEVS